MAFFWHDRFFQVCFFLKKHLVKKCLIFYQIFKVCTCKQFFIHAKIQLQHIVQNSIPSFWKIIILLFAHILYLKRTIKRVIVHHPDEITVKKKITAQITTIHHSWQIFVLPSIIQKQNVMFSKSNVAVLFMHTVLYLVLKMCQKWQSNILD